MRMNKRDIAEFTTPRFLLGFLIMSLATFAQSVPPLFPEKQFDVREFSRQTASHSSQMPPSLLRTIRADQLQQAPDQVEPNGVKLPSLKNVRRERDPNTGHPYTGEVRMLPTDIKDLWKSSRGQNQTRVQRLRLQSTGASEIRLHFKNFDIGSAKLWIYPDRPQIAIPAILGPYTGKGMHGDGEFWSPTIFGDAAVVEISNEQIDYTSATPVFLLSIDQVLHGYQETDVTSNVAYLDAKPFTPGTASDQDGGKHAAIIPANSCNVDATCHPEYANLGSGVASYSFIRDGLSNVCSGALINTISNSRKPYFATAHHCVSDEATARTVEAYFNYASASCNRSPVDRELAYRVSGSRHLTSKGLEGGDYSLLFLLEAPPASSTFLGWTLDDLIANQEALSIHHPRGSWRRIWFGKSRSDTVQSTITGNYHFTTTSVGVVEGGSSGSPLISRSGRLLGTLRSVDTLVLSAICSTNQQGLAFGKFSSAWPAYRSFLSEETVSGVSLSTNRADFQVDGTIFVGPTEVYSALTTTSPFSLTYRAFTSDKWIQVSPSFGQIATSNPARLSITVDASYFEGDGLRTGVVHVATGSLTPLSISVSANVKSSGSEVSLSVSPNPVLKSTPDADGYDLSFNIGLVELGGRATSLTALTLDGQDYSASISNWFGSNTIDAFGARNASLRSRNFTLPTIRTFTVGGVDGNPTRRWSRSIRVPFLERLPNARLRITNFPEEIRESPNGGDCRWSQFFSVSESGGHPVRLTKLVVGGQDVTSTLSKVFDQSSLLAMGNSVGVLCWANAPSSRESLVELTGVDDLGQALTTKHFIRFLGPVTDPARITISSRDVHFRAAPSSVPRPTELTVGLSRSASWSVREILHETGHNWLSVNTMSATGTGTLRLWANSASLPPGNYRSKVILESPQSEPQVIIIQATLVVEAPPQPNLPQLSTGGVVHNATYGAVLTRGGLATAFGSNLSGGSAAVASQLPLPFSLGGTSILVNGRPAPLLYSSNGQINFQVPWETEIGVATLAVEVAGKKSQATFQVGTASPGIYTADGRSLVPSSRAARGSVFLAFATGVGDVWPPIVAGTAPASTVALSDLPAPVRGVTATVGGVPAKILFAAIPYGLVGIIQLNIEVPIEAPTGEQPLVIKIGDTVSPPAYISVE